MADPQEIASKLTAAVLQPMPLPANDTDARRLAEKIAKLYAAILREVTEIHQ